MTESSGNSLSKPDTVSGVYRVTEGGAVDLPCMARGQPLPSYTWFKVNPVTGAQEPLSASPSLFPRHSVLSIVGANAGDSGRYICRVHNKVSLNFNIGEPQKRSKQFDLDFNSPPSFLYQRSGCSQTQFSGSIVMTFLILIKVMQPVITAP